MMMFITLTLFLTLFTTEAGKRKNPRSKKFFFKNDLVFEVTKNLFNFRRRITYKLLSYLLERRERTPAQKMKKMSSQGQKWCKTFLEMDHTRELI